MGRRKIVVHVLGALGEGRGVPEDLLTSRSYVGAVGRSLILGPLTADSRRLVTEGDSEVIFGGKVGAGGHPYGRALAEVERKFRVKVVYGRRRFAWPNGGVAGEAEVVLVDAREADCNPVNGLKAWLYDEFGIDSLQYEHDTGYDMAVRLAPASLACLRAVKAADPKHPSVLVAHDVDGLPTALGAVLDPLQSFKTLFWARELPTVGRLIAGHPGHETMFFTAAAWARQSRYYLHEVFGAQQLTYRYRLMTASRHCDNVAAVGERGRRLMRFLDPTFENVHVDRGFHGVKRVAVEASAKRQWRAVLGEALEGRLGYRPEWIFTHSVPATARSGWWRDLRVLEQFDSLLGRSGRQDRGRDALGTGGEDRGQDALGTGRGDRGQDALGTGREDRGQDALGTGRDALGTGEKRGVLLVRDPRDGAEAAAGGDEAVKVLDEALAAFNERCGHFRAVRYSHEARDGACLVRPGALAGVELRLAADVEFYQTIYDPVAVQSLETLAGGGLCVLGSACGSVGLLERAGDAPTREHVLVTDYAELGRRPEEMRREEILSIGQPQRNEVEHRIACQAAEELYGLLVVRGRDWEKMQEAGVRLTEAMEADAVCGQYFLPAVDRAYRRFRARQIA